MQVTNVKQEAYHLVENLSENATWDDLMYEIYVEDSKAGRTIDIREVRAKFGLSK